MNITNNLSQYLNFEPIITTARKYTSQEYLDHSIGLMKTQRSFEAELKKMQTQDEMLQDIIDLKR